MFLHKLHKCSIHQYENTDNLETEARTDVNFINSCSSWRHCTLPTGCYCSPVGSYHMYSAASRRDRVSAPSSTTDKINYISLKKQNTRVVVKSVQCWLVKKMREHSWYRQEISDGKSSYGWHGWRTRPQDSHACSRLYSNISLILSKN